MKMLVFTEGTVLMHAAAESVSRAERVRQSEARVEGIEDFACYVPNGEAEKKLARWKEQGAEIYYLTSRVELREVEEIGQVLTKYKFPDAANLLFRGEGQTYSQVAEELMPDILIEDDCVSIGGEAEMTYPHIDPEKQKKIKSVVVKEFGGIEHLPDELREFLMV